MGRLFRFADAFVVLISVSSALEGAPSFRGAPDVLEGRQYVFFLEDNKKFEKMKFSDFKSSIHINEYHIVHTRDIIKSFPLHFINTLKCLEIYGKKNN